MQKLLVYKFYTDKCKPCEVMQPIWEDFKKMFPYDAITYEEINLSLEENTERGEILKIRTVPTFVFVFGGDEKQIIGTRSLESLVDHFQEFADLHNMVFPNE